MLKLLFKEPLVHFCIGALLVFFWFQFTEGKAGDDKYIEVNAAQIDVIAARFIEQWRRVPREAELNALIENAVNDELLYREGIALGLDKDDAVVRNRVIQKLKFVNEGPGDNPEESQLEEWLSRHPEKYKIGVQYSFEQIYLGRDLDIMRVETLKLALNRGDTPARGGPPLPIPKNFDNMNSEDIEEQFGVNFTKNFPTLPLGEWIGPEYSGFGGHLVRIHARKGARAAQLKDVRKRVENDWRAAQKKEVQEQYFTDLRAQYDIQIAPIPKFLREHIGKNLLKADERDNEVGGKGSEG